MISLLFADTQTPSAAAQPVAPPFFMHPIPLMVIFLIFFYFLVYRPQQQRTKDQKKMLSNLKKGDRIITSSGFYAVVVGIGDSSIEVKLSENVKAKILKSSVSEVLGNQDTVTATVTKPENEKKI